MIYVFSVRRGTSYPMSLTLEYMGFLVTLAIIVGASLRILIVLRGSEQLKKYRCTVRFRAGNLLRMGSEYIMDAESITEAAKNIRDKFPLRSPVGHQGFKIEEVG